MFNSIHYITTLTSTSLHKCCLRQSLWALVIIGCFQQPTDQIFFLTLRLRRSVAKEVACEGSPWPQASKVWNTSNLEKQQKWPFVQCAKCRWHISGGLPPFADTLIEGIQVAFCKVDGQNRPQVCGPITKSVCENRPPTLPLVSNSGAHLCWDSLFRCSSPKLRRIRVEVFQLWVLWSRQQETRRGSLWSGPLIGLVYLCSWNKSRYYKTAFKLAYY